jgi:alpha-ketoglutarate-dependent taurine dioxygenase
MRNSHIEIRPIAGALGAEIGGVDVAEDLDEAVVGEIRQALLDYGVIFFRDQKLDVVGHKAFTRRFGEIFIHPNYKGVRAAMSFERLLLIVAMTALPSSQFFGRAFLLWHDAG